MPVKRPLLSKDTIIIYVPWRNASAGYLCVLEQEPLFKFTFTIFGTSHS